MLLSPSSPHLRAQGITQGTPFSLSFRCSAWSSAIDAGNNTQAAGSELERRGRTHWDASGCTAGHPQPLFLQDRVRTDPHSWQQAPSAPGHSPCLKGRADHISHLRDAPAALLPQASSILPPASTNISASPPPRNPTQMGFCRDEVGVSLHKPPQGWPLSHPPKNQRGTSTIPVCVHLKPGSKRLLSRLAVVCSQRKAGESGAFYCRKKGTTPGTRACAREWWEELMGFG